MMNSATSSEEVASSQLVLVWAARRLAAWQVSPDGKLHALKLKGQIVLLVDSRQGLTSAVNDVAVRLQDDDVSLGQVHWLIDVQGRALLKQGIPENSWFVDIPWQLLSLDWVCQRAGLLQTGIAAHDETIEKTLIPWLVVTDDAAERGQMKAARNLQHETESDRLAAQRLHLEQTNQQLRDQNKALQQVDMEFLVAFLPALFKQVFATLGASDLALLCGSLRMPDIPSPYPEPSKEALRNLQRKFRAKPVEDQCQIVNFVADLPHRQRLKVRPEMRELVNELQERVE